MEHGHRGASPPPGASATAVAVVVAVTPLAAPSRPQVLAKGDTLLCTQRWRNGAAAGAPPAWRLAQHRTIPYSFETDAGAALRCDRRGCVGLQRSGLRGAPGMPGDGMS